MKDYVIVKLATGEDVMGRVLNSDDSHYLLNFPQVVMTKWAEAGNLQMGLIPFMAFAHDDKVAIYRSSIVAECDPPRELIQEYTKMTSGIILPN